MAKKRTKPNSPPKKWSSDWSVGVRVWVEKQGQTILDEATADLLTALDRTNSISAAARLLDISYSHAWLLIQEANQNAGKPLTQATIGGQRGGGASLTEYGRAALDAFRMIQVHVRTAAAKSLPKIVSPVASETAVVHLAAAISLQEVMVQVLSEYALVRPTVSVRTIFGASNELAEQIQAGSSTDVFISASSLHIERLDKQGTIQCGSRRLLASNGLAIVGPTSFKGMLRKPQDLCEIKEGPIIVADPACPLGKASADFLKASGLYDKLHARLKRVDNSRAVVALLRTGGAQLGIIFNSDIANLAGLVTLLQIPTAQFKTVYEGAVIATSTVREEANALLDFLTTKTAQNAFRRCGFFI